MLMSDMLRETFVQNTAFKTLAFENTDLKSPHTNTSPATTVYHLILTVMSEQLLVLRLSETG